MNILAVETSSTVAGAAILADGKLVAECYQDHKLTHSEMIMPMVEQVMRMAQLTCADIDRFAVDVGPGSFTGVRIGVCCVNGMAAAVKKPVAAVDSLLAVAAGLPYFAGSVAVIADARGVQIYGGLFDTSCGMPSYIGERMAGELEEFLDALPIDGPLLFAGDGAAAHRARIAERFPGAKFAPAHLNKPRASSLAMAAVQAETAKEAMPVYLRKPQAQRMREQNG